MIIEKIIMTDFRVFKGENIIDLIPRKKWNKKRPIILFGGLNGAGKTTTLTAIRLALYGRQSLGLSATKKDYESFLKESIHKSKNSITQASTSSVELIFNYASMGDIKYYRVRRSWMIRGKTITEDLSLYEDGKKLSELNYEQCQGFLNELIPIGVSDLFFFDGEKISELAEDTSGMNLGESIKKLLGLDLIETLNADLSVLLRNKAKQGASDNTGKKIEQLENQLKEIEVLAEQELKKYEEYKILATSCKSELKNLENKLSSRGGAWAKSREQEIKIQADLTAQKKQLEKELREIIEGSFPLSLAGSYIEKTITQLENECQYKKSLLSIEQIDKHIDSLNKKFRKILDKKIYQQVLDIIQNEFSNEVNSYKGFKVIHDVSDSVFIRIKSCLLDAQDKQKKKVVILSNNLNKLDEEIDQSGKNISRAPDKSLLDDILKSISDKQKEISQLSIKQKHYMENHKRHIREQMDIVRQLDKLSEVLSNVEEYDQIINYINGSKLVLSEFAKRSSESKIKDLEQEFIKSFCHLSRKDDLNIKAEIDPNTFMVKLLGADGQTLHKNELSAGEKQIYAISILEALARTSGRNLPIIIDTPLGRLDSKHRINLIRHYFPYASHQVIILSTDTEVDESFYQELNKYISHAYKLEYLSESACTVAIEGYFWKTKHLEAV